MQVILLERIAGLGNMGEEVVVKPGFARNFLLPQGKALPATKANQTVYEARRAELESDNETRKSQAEGLAAKLEGVKVTIQRQASETGMLYGSVKSRDIAEAVTAQGVELARSAVQIGEPIKEVGEFTVKVALHPEVVETLTVNVERQSA